MANFWRSTKQLLFTAYQRLYFTSLYRRIQPFPAVISSLQIVFTTKMSLACSHIPLALESPFSHVDVYGVEHPTFGSSSRRSINRRKSKHSSHKGSAISIKPRRSSVSVSSRSSHASSTRKMIHKKKKKKKVSNPSGSSASNDVTPHNNPVKKDTKGSSFQERAQFHQLRSPTAVSNEPIKKTCLGSSSQERARFHPMKSSTGVLNASLARVDNDSPVLARQKSSPYNSIQNRHWKTDTKKTESRPLNAPSDSTSGYGSVLSRSNKARAQTYSNSRTTLSSSNFSTISLSASTTDEVILSLNHSQHTLKTQIINSPINVSLKRATQNISSHLSPMRQPKRVFGTGVELRQNKRLTGTRKKGEAMTVGDIAWGLARLQYRNIIVMSGAGISTPSGIPDFRLVSLSLSLSLYMYVFLCFYICHCVLCRRVYEFYFIYFYLQVSMHWSL